MILDRSKKTSNLFVKFFPPILLIILLIGACAPALQTKVLNRNSGTIPLIVFVDTPFKTIDTGQKEKSPIPFYQWIFEAFRYKSGQGIVIFDDKTVVSHAMAKGIRPVVLYRDNNPKSDIIHLAFDEIQLEELYTVAENIGALYLVKARLIANETKVVPRSQITWGPVILSGKFDQMLRTTIVEFSIYDVKSQDMILTKEFTSTEASMGFTDYRVRDNLTSAVVAVLLSQSSKMPQPEPQQPSRITINKVVKIEIPKIEGGRYFLEIRFVTLENTSIIDKNLLRFDLSFRDYHDEKLRIVFRRDAYNKLATYTVDRFGIRYNAISSGLSGDSIDVRPGERKDIFFIFPMPATPVKQVNMYSTWDIQTLQRTHTFTLEFKDVPIP